MQIDAGGEVAIDPGLARPTTGPRHVPDPRGAPLVPVSYRDGSARLTGWFAAPVGGRGPGVIVAHEAPGLDDHARARAQLLAEAGYAALAIDMYGQPFDVAAAAARHEALMAEPGLLLRRAAAGVEALVLRAEVQDGALGAVGFCQGGVVSTELALEGLVGCGVGLHPALRSPAGSRERRTDARIVLLVGDDDPFNPPEARDAFLSGLRRSGADWSMHLLGGVRHTFTNPAADALDHQGLRYDARSDARAWRTVLDTLGESLGRPGEPAPAGGGDSGS